MYRRMSLVLPVMVLLWAPKPALSADDSQGARRRQQAQEFHFRAQERTGVLVPMYVYPANVHKNSAYNRLIDLKRRVRNRAHVGHPQPSIGAGESG